MFPHTQPKEAHPLAIDVAKAQAPTASPTIDYLDSLLTRLREAGVHHYSDGRITVDIERRSAPTPQSAFREGYKGKV